MNTIKKSKITLKQFKKKVFIYLTLAVIVGLFIIWFVAETFGWGVRFVVIVMILFIPNVIIVGKRYYRKTKNIYLFPEEDIN